MYIVLEIQETTEGDVPNTITYTAATLNEAKSKYHYVLHYAAVSELYRHGAVLMMTDGRYIANESYIHVSEETNEPA